MTESNVMLPCPFCGSEAEIEPWHGGEPDRHRAGCSSVTCDACPAVVDETRQDTIDLWNRRAPALALRTPSDGEVVGIPGMKAISALIDEQGHAKNCLVVHFDHEVTDADRRNIVAAHNAALSAAAKVRAIREGDGPRPLDLREMDADDEAVEWVSRNLHGLRHDSGTIEYTLASVVRAFQAGRAASPIPATGGEKE